MPIGLWYTRMTFGIGARWNSAGCMSVCNAWATGHGWLYSSVGLQDFVLVGKGEGIGRWRGWYRESF